MTVKLSQPGKMPCKSWSLQALDTCPGSRGDNGDLVPACKGCYATQGNYRFKNVKAVRIANREDWRRESWVSDMVAAIGKDPYFRWFDSGDMYHKQLAEKIYQVMRACPDTQFWLPTRMHKFNAFKKIIQRMNTLQNVVVRLSGDGIRGEIIRGRTVSTIYNPADQAPPAGAITCSAYQNAGKCGDCRACWDRDVKLIAYPQHGQVMAKTNRDLIARG